MRRHQVFSLMVSLSCARNVGRLHECHWITLVTAVTIATADGSPLSGAWS